MGPEEHDRVVGMKIATLLNLGRRCTTRTRRLERLRKVTDEDPECTGALEAGRIVSGDARVRRREENLARVVELDPSLARDVDAKLRRIRTREVAARGVERREMEGKLAEPTGAS